MIYIQTLDLEWTPGSKMLKDQTTGIRKAFEEFIAYEFVIEIKRSIDTQKYKSKWKPLSPQYLAYKKKRGLSPIIWEATKELKSTLKVMHRQGYITIGWDKRVLHKSSKKILSFKTKTKVPIYKIAKYMEFGTLRTPPRPLFRFVYQAMSKNIRKYWEKFSKMFLSSSNTRYKQTFSRNKRKALTQYLHDMKLNMASLFKIFRRKGGD